MLMGSDAPIPPNWDWRRRPEGRPAAASITQDYLASHSFFLRDEMQVIRRYRSWGATAAGRSPRERQYFC